MYKPTANFGQLAELNMFKMTVWGSLFAVVGLTGCSSTPKSSSEPQKSQNLTASTVEEWDDIKDPLEDLLSATDMRAVEGDRLQILKHGDVWKRMTMGFSMNHPQADARIAAQRSWFISRQPYIDRLSARASRYLYHTVKEAERRGLPTELALLPIIESSYDPAATSSAAAAGLWQFIPSTGKIYGLKQNSTYDGRRDVVESTRAAYEFLGSLYNQFGSWELALASYNAGPGRIQQAINRNKAAGLPTDFWSLKLPQETMDYVPRFLAVAQIVKNPSMYGVYLPPIANRPHFREIYVRPMSLNEAVTITGLTRAELYALNPGYRGDVIDANSPMRLLVPADLNPSLDARLRSTSATTGLLATQTIPSVGKPSSSVTPPVLTAQTAPSPTTTATPSTDTTRISTPQGSMALAAFAAQSDLPSAPSAPRVPIAVTQALNVQPVNVEPPLTDAERDTIMAAVRAEGSTKTIDEVFKPVASQDEQAILVAELKQLAPLGTEIVDPTDGKIKLTAIQTSLSIAEQQGQELTKAFSYPKSVADNTPQNSEEVQRNQGKNVTQTASEVVVAAPKGKRSVYSVVSGDTLMLIAMKHDLNWLEVAKWNQIDPYATLYVGTRIYLYDAKPQQQQQPQQQKQPITPAPVTKINAESYTVQANDTLSQVAERFGVGLKQLADLNGLSTTSGIMIGQKLNLPNAAKVTAQETPVTTPNTTTQVKTKDYTVKRGDTLSTIAEQHHMGLGAFAELNNLTRNSNVLLGQKLKVPVDALVTPDIYEVKRGDTLSTIASKYQLKTEYVAKLNNISANSNVRLGQKLRLIDKADSSPVVAKATEAPTHTKAAENNSKAPETEVYVVKSGETLNSIARKHNLQLKYLADLNDLTVNTKVRIGQRLKVDKAEDTVKQVVEKTKTAHVNSLKTEAYKVKSGDSLNALSARLGISVAELASLNDMSAQAGLQIGQVIAIPKKFTDYKVKRGDTLIGLAARHGIESKDLADLNNLKPSTQLRVGQVIQVPNS